MAEPRSLSILFRPGMQPFERHTIEDTLEDALGTLGEITGGGTAVDLSYCDIGIEVTDFGPGLWIIREVLRRLKVPESTVIEEVSPSGFSIEYRNEVFALSVMSS